MLTMNDNQDNYDEQAAAYKGQYRKAIGALGRALKNGKPNARFAQAPMQEAATMMQMRAAGK
jgi:hypothetical protein